MAALLRYDHHIIAHRKRVVGNKDILNCRRTGAGRPAFFSLLTADALNATRKTLPAPAPWKNAVRYRSLKKIKSPTTMYFFDIAGV
jgi:hypothetical protein